MTHSVHTLNIDFKASVPFCFTTFKNVSLMNISEEKTLCLLFFIEDRKSIDPYPAQLNKTSILSSSLASSKIASFLVTSRTRVVIPKKMNEK